MPTPKCRKNAIEVVTAEEVKDFSEHCTFIRSVYKYYERILVDSDDTEQKLMESIASLFFSDIDEVIIVYLITFVCRITEPAVDSTGKNHQLSVNTFVRSSNEGDKMFDSIIKLECKMKKLRLNLMQARNKIIAHADRSTIRSRTALGAADRNEWDVCWLALREFVMIINQKFGLGPFDIDAGGPLGDAEQLLKALQQSQHFERLLESGDRAVSDACLALAVPND